MPPSQLDYERAIAHVVIDINTLEIKLEESIWDLTGADILANTIITAGLDYKLLIRLFRALFINRIQLAQNSALMEECKKFFNDAEFINVERNKYVHSKWQAGLDRQGQFSVLREKHSITKMTGLEIDKDYNSYPELIEYSKKVIAAFDTLKALMTKAMPDIQKGIEIARTKFSRAVFL